MLDLSTVCAKLYQIKMADGTVLELKRPTQALYTTILQLADKAKTDNADMQLIDAAMEVFVRILNRNTEGIEFTREELESDYDFTVALMVMGDYMKFYAEEIKNTVNFQVAQQTLA